MNARVFDAHQNHLGEGALWHPGRQELFWFDILGLTMHHKGMEGPRLSWKFQDRVSAAGLIGSNQSVLVAYQGGLCTFELFTTASTVLAEFPDGEVATRSNDGRADRQGGFWIGTMGLNAEQGAGAIYRFYRGEFRKLHDGITIPNAICFSTDGGTAHFADTRRKLVWRQALDRHTGWPISDPEVYLDFNGQDGGPDGAVIDAAGDFWVAEWGAARVACYGRDGALKQAFALPTGRVSCPAFGGPDLSTLFVSTAQEGMSVEEIAADPGAGRTFAIETGARGVEEPRVLLA